MKNFVLLLVILLVGCGSSVKVTRPPIAQLPTAVPTEAIVEPTPTLLEVTVAPPTAEMATTTAEPVPPVATATPLPTPTFDTATLQPSPEVEATPAPIVNYFRFASPPVRPSQPTLLEWDVSGVERVIVSRHGGTWAEAGQMWELEATGQAEHTFPITLGGESVRYVLTASGVPAVRAEFVVDIPCEYEWGFDVSAESCPGLPLDSNAAFQQFEGGFMLWTESADTILYSSWDGTIFEELTDTFDESVDPLRDETLTPPEGYFQPDYGFGKLWRERDDVRQLLGWGITQPVNFISIRQPDSVNNTASSTLIGLPEDGYLSFKGSSLVMRFEKPMITLAERRPPADMSSLSPTPIAGEITVNYFRFAAEPTKPSDVVLLEWDVSGVESIEVSRDGGEWNEAEADYELPATGTLEQTFAPVLGGWPIIYVVNACNESGCIEYVFSAELPCEYPILIEAISQTQGCLTEGIVSRGFQQNFENGFMLWIEAQNSIIYSTWDGLTHGEVNDSFEHGVDPVRDETIVPPSGLYQPEYGIGKVWREQSGVRELLGWATDWGAEYTAIRQSERVHRYGFREWLTMLNGGLITMSHPDPIWIIQYPR